MSMNFAKLTMAKKGFRAGERFYSCPKWSVSIFPYFIVYVYEITNYGLMNIFNCRIPIANLFNWESDVVSKENQIE